MNLYRWARKRTQEPQTSKNRLRSLFFVCQVFICLTFSPVSYAQESYTTVSNFVREFVGHSSEISAIAISPDGKKLLSGACGYFDSNVSSGCLGGELKLWNVTTGKEIRSFVGHGDRVFQIVFSPDGSKAVSSSSYGSLILWDLVSGNKILSFGDGGETKAIAFSPDGRKILVANAGTEYTLSLWDSMTGDKMIIFNGHSGEINSVAFSYDGYKIASGGCRKSQNVYPYYCVEGELILWDVATGKATKTFLGHGSSIRLIAFSSDDHQITSVSEEYMDPDVFKTYISWDIATGTILNKSLQVNSAGATAFSPYQGIVASSSSVNNTFTLWDIITKKTIVTFASGDTGFYKIAFSTEGDIYSVNYGDLSIKMWQAVLAPTASFTATPSNGAAPLTVVLDASASSDSDGSVVEYNYTINGQPISVSNSTSTSRTDYEVTEASSEKITVSGTATTVNRRTLTVVFKTNGTYTIGLKVKDNSGLFSSEATRTVIVGQTCNYTLSPTSKIHTANTETGSVSVTASNSNCQWTATSNQTWSSINSGASNTGNGTVTYAVQANIDSQQRTGTLTIAGQTFNLTQDKGKLKPVALFTATPDNGNAPLKVVLDASASKDPDGSIVQYDWFVDGSAMSTAAKTYSIETGTQSLQKTITFSTEGTYVVKLQVTDNDGLTSEDSKTITVKAVNCTYTISPLNKTHTANAETGSVVVTASNNSCQWTAISNQAWSSISSGASGTGNGTVTYAVQANTDSQQRTGTLTIAGQTFNLTQDKGKLKPIASFTATPDNGNAPLKVVLDASASKDPDGNIMQYDWFVDGSAMSISAKAYGIEAGTQGLQKNITFYSAGTYLVELKVTDNDSLTDNMQRQIIVGQQALKLTPSDFTFSAMPVLPDAPAKSTRSSTRISVDLNRPHTTGRVIVKFNPVVSEETRAILRANFQAKRLLTLELIQAEVWEVTDVAQTIVDYQQANSAEIAYIEPDYQVTLNAQPNDPHFNSLWGLHNVGQTGGNANADINAPEAWDVTQGNSNTVCGVIDTGVDYNHPDLAANMWKNPNEIPNNGIDDDKNGYVDDVYGYDFANEDGDPMDDNGHGTHVSGTMAALGNNGVGVAGINWKGKIVALKFLSASGSGSITGAIRAVEYATKMKLPCTNNSWGGGGYSQALIDAIQATGQQGGIFVAAAGNSAQNADTYPMYPAAYNLWNIVSVCASDHTDTLAAFSNYGATSVDLCAPGVNILSTFPNNQYASASGTSMASPHVAGASMLLQAYAPYLQAQHLKALLMASADVKSSLAGKNLTGARLNLQKALTMIVSPEVFTLSNSGNSTVSLTTPVLNGTNSSDFVIQSTTCGTTLAANAQCTITVVTAPYMAGTKQATLNISSASATLKGQGNTISSSSLSSMELSSSKSSTYNPNVAKAVLPAVTVGEQVYSVTLCQDSAISFTVCDIKPSQNTPHDLGNSSYDITTGILNIPVVKLEIGSNPPLQDYVGFSTQYEVQMKVLSLPDGKLGTEILNVMPIW